GAGPDPEVAGSVTPDEHDLVRHEPGFDSHRAHRAPIVLDDEPRRPDRFAVREHDAAVRREGDGGDEVLAQPVPPRKTAGAQPRQAQEALLAGGIERARRILREAPHAVRLLAPDADPLEPRRARSSSQTIHTL